MSDGPNIMIAGGGTGGHLFPAMAVAKRISELRPDATIAFAGTERGLEYRLIPNTPWKLYTVPVYGLSGTGFLRRLLALTLLPAAMQAASRIVGEFKPDLVIGVGGYASAPVLFSAGMRRIPRVILEQNAIPGVTNRIFGPSVDRVFVSFKEAILRFKPNRAGNRDHISCPGNPVRDELLNLPEKTSEHVTDPAAPHLLVFGGSQGAEALNDAMLAIIKGLMKKLPGLTVTHQTGRYAATPMGQKYVRIGAGEASKVDVMPFIDDMAAAYEAADLVLCRSGATSVAELTAIGKPSLLVPYPHATHDHQTHNAKALVDAGAAILIPQTDLPDPEHFGPDPKAEALIDILVDLLGDPTRLATMAHSAKQLGRPKAADDIANACLNLIQSEPT
jgi:UDP-N-acetylglucosamine--N-acetylmuramyl-(pentapeptide) pyrophosphoryl-undecaprenol N-acetylglucosamine transferase